jgi:hypothetical protein
LEEIDNKKWHVPKKLKEQEDLKYVGTFGCLVYEVVCHGATELSLVVAFVFVFVLVLVFSS